MLSSPISISISISISIYLSLSIYIYISFSWLIYYSAALISTRLNSWTNQSSIGSYHKANYQSSSANHSSICSVHLSLIVKRFTVMTFRLNTTDWILMYHSSLTWWCFIEILQLIRREPERESSGSWLTFLTTFWSWSIPRCRGRRKCSLVWHPTQLSLWAASW